MSETAQRTALGEMAGTHSLILGGSGAMGSAIAARIMALEGAVSLVGREAAPLEEAVASLGQPRSSWRPFALMSSRRAESA